MHDLCVARRNARYLRSGRRGCRPTRVRPARPSAAQVVENGMAHTEMRRLLPFCRGKQPTGVAQQRGKGSMFAEFTKAKGLEGFGSPIGVAHEYRERGQRIAVASSLQDPRVR